MRAHAMRSKAWTFDAAWAELKRFYFERPVLVAGADGFLGSACVELLGALGAELSLLGRRRGGPARGAGRRIEGDLSERALAATAAAGQSVVIDCIGAAGAVASNQRPDDNLLAECLPHLNLFRACAESRSPPTVVFLSSRLVYGRPKSLPVDETHPVQPQSFYAAHKLNVENYLEVLAHTHSLPSVVLRLSNPYGPHEPAPGRDYGIVNRFIRDAFRGGTLRVYGDGQQLRDYIYVDDVITAILMCGMTETCRGQTFNLGGPQPISLRDAVSVILESCGSDAGVEFVPWPADALRVETGDYWTDTSKLRSVVALPPQLDFSEGVRRTMQCLAELP